MQSDTILSYTGIPTRDYDPMSGIKNYFTGYQLCGCCGARQVYCVEDFNNPTQLSKENTFDDVFNRGILIWLNPDKPKEIVAIPGTEVKIIKLGQDTLYVRLMTTR